jgi:protein-L-isoaspartate(D-aspartate) O-methyltransferase
MRIISIILGLSLLADVITQSCVFAADPVDSFEKQRLEMVNEQLSGRDIYDPEVLKAMTAVPRHLFVPVKIRDLAYQDGPLPIGYDQTISQPYIVALMSQLLALKSGDRVLEIGTGSGYQAAVLAQMGTEVFTIEIVSALGNQAKKVLEQLGYDRVKVKIGDGYLGWPESAPFDGIIVTCAPTSVPEPLKNQLAEGGRMVIPVGERGYQQLYLLTKQDGRIMQKKVIDVRFVPMVDKKGKNY